MPNQDLLDILKIESDEILAAFNKASITGRGTAQEIADTREAFVQVFLKRYFPFPFQITKGKIRDSLGSLSNSIDCLVLNPSHPHTVDSSNRYSLILCDGVDVAIEVKPDIQSKAELERGLAQIQSVKKLKRFRTGLLLPKKKAPDLVEFSSRVPSFIFSIKAKSNPMDTAREVRDWYLANATPVEEQVDAIVINKVGVIMNHKILDMAPKPNGQPEKGLYFEDWGDQTLARFLSYLNVIPASEPRMGAPILIEYLRGISCQVWKV